MEKLATLARHFVGLACLGSGLEQLVTLGFVRLVPKLPAWLPAQSFWAGATGVMLVLIGGAILTDRKIRLAAVSLAGLLLVLLGFRLPELAADSGALVNPGKVLVLGGGALLLGGRGKKWPWVAPVLLGIFLATCGWAHFRYSGFVDTLVPAWIPPSRRFWTCFSAVALLAGGLGVILPPTRRAAGLASGLMIFLWVVLLHIPRTVELKTLFELDGVFEALAISGVALLVAAAHPRPAAGTTPEPQRRDK